MSDDFIGGHRENVGVVERRGNRDLAEEIRGAKSSFGEFLVGGNNPAVYHRAADHDNNIGLLYFAEKQVRIHYVGDCPDKFLAADELRRLLDGKGIDYIEETDPESIQRIRQYGQQLLGLAKRLESQGEKQ